MSIFIEFTLKENYIKEIDFKKNFDLGNEIGAMLWTIMKNIKS